MEHFFQDKDDCWYTKRNIQERYFENNFYWRYEISGGKSVGNPAAASYPAEEGGLKQGAKGCQTPWRTIFSGCLLNV